MRKLGERKKGLESARGSKTMLKGRGEKGRPKSGVSGGGKLGAASKTALSRGKRTRKRERAVLL